MQTHSSAEGRPAGGGARTRLSACGPRLLCSQALHARLGTQRLLGSPMRCSMDEQRPHRLLAELRGTNDERSILSTMPTLHSPMDDNGSLPSTKGEANPASTWRS